MQGEAERALRCQPRFAPNPLQVFDRAGRRTYGPLPMRKLVQAESQTPKTTPMGIVLSSFRDGRRPTSLQESSTALGCRLRRYTIATAFYAVTTPWAGRLCRPDGATSRPFTRGLESKTCVCSGARTRGAKRPCRSGTGSFVIPETRGHSGSGAGGEESLRRTLAEGGFRLRGVELEVVSP